MMGLRLIIVAALSASFAVLLVHCAPTFLASANDDAAGSSAAAAALAAEKPLVRRKRAEEILYGNHQNAPRVKKSDPAAATSEDVISTKNDDVTKDDMTPESTDTNEKEKIIDSEQSASADQQDEILSESEPPPNLENIPAALNDADYQKYNDQDGLEDAETLRKKRSIKTAMMSAENMIDSSSSSSSHRSSLISRPVRAKRDLDYEDLRQLFANSREAPYEELEDGEEPGGRVYEMAPEQGAEEDDDREREEEEREEPGMVEDVPLGVALPYEYESRYEAPSEKEELLRELVERKVEEDAREKLLDYLLAAAIASEAESTDETETNADVDDDEGIIDAAPGRPDYEDESARDVIGIGPRVALKRNFYPYSYEPYGGRWGAMVPGTKRSANEYERLYRLAEALNAGDDYEEE